MRKILSIRSLLVALGMLVLCSVSFAQFGVAVSFGPPELPVYEQPICPGDDYIWTPGYWAWDGYDYYWVPGTWILAPQPGYFWTPAWWGWGGSGFIFHEGYWGPHIGFYGGINYGYGYFGHGYEGGRWEHDHFYYNRTVNNVNVNIIHNTYNTTIVNNYGNSHVSYNGGRGGIEARATGEEESAIRERHIAPVRAQVEHVQAARGNPEFRSSANHGRPPVAASSRPGAFSDNSRVSASEGHGYGANSARPENYSRDPGTAIHPKELPPNSRLTAPNTGNSGRDRKYQQQQQQLYSRQEQERQQLQQKQEQEHQRYTQQQANQERQQQLDRQHQQQTQQLAQQHYQQQVQMQQRQQPRESGHNESGHNKGKP